MFRYVLLRNRLLVHCRMPHIVPMNCLPFPAISAALCIAFGELLLPRFTNVTASYPLLPESMSQRRTPLLREVRVSATGNLLNQTDQRPQRSTQEREWGQPKGRVYVGEGREKNSRAIIFVLKDTHILRKHTGAIAQRLSK